MIHMYIGDGKGKTTAAVGLAVRAAGHGIPVIFAQFLKDGTSGELTSLQKIEEVTVMKCRPIKGFIKNASEEDAKMLRASYEEMLADVEEMSKKYSLGCVIILDEVLHACNNGLILEERLISLIMGLDNNTELVLTGMNPSKELMEQADYISEVKKVRHPYDEGACARAGIEF